MIRHNAPPIWFEILGSYRKMAAFNQDQMETLQDMMKGFATKEDLKAFATKDEVAELRKEVAELKTIIQGLFRSPWKPNMTCAICIEDMEPGANARTRCGHIFHIDCIMTHYNNHSTLCPMCRREAHPIRHHTLECQGSPGQMDDCGSR